MTRNLGRWVKSQKWLSQVTSEGALDLLFLQEVPQGLQVPQGYVALPEDLRALAPGHCRTVTLVAERHRAAVTSAAFVLPDLLHDYVTLVEVALPGYEAVQLLNVHASPRPVDFDEEPFRDWRRNAEKRLYYSDVISRELVRLAATGPVVAVGDFNEAHAWDPAYKTTTSAEFFGRLAQHGLVDITGRDWVDEAKTQTKHPYQVDRIFAGGGASASVAPASQAVPLDDDGLSDHFPIKFTIFVDPAPVQLIPDHSVSRPEIHVNTSRTTCGTAPT